MPALFDHLDALRQRGEKALVPFVTAGDPPLDQLPAVLEALVEGGADVIELGIPFSDPIADGPVIQASSQRALDVGTTPKAILDLLAGLSLPVPVVLMGYLNPMLRVGLSEFAAQAKHAGVAGILVSDLTPEESDEWSALAKQAGIDTVFLVAPTSTPDRIQAAANRATGFVYAVSRTGVTGEQTTVPPEVGSLVESVRACTTCPVLVGFGISRPEHVSAVCKVADGAIVGSALVRMLASSWQSGAGKSAVTQFMRELKVAATA